MQARCIFGLARKNVCFNGPRALAPPAALTAPAKLELSDRHSHTLTYIYVKFPYAHAESASNLPCRVARRKLYIAPASAAAPRWRPGELSPRVVVVVDVSPWWCPALYSCACMHGPARVGGEKAAMQGTVGGERDVGFGMEFGRNGRVVCRRRVERKCL